jgi:hypothetical protein
MIPVVLLLTASLCATALGGYQSILGDPAMASPVAAVGFESWNMCNGASVPAEYNAPYLPSPPLADCVSPTSLQQIISVGDNDLSPGDVFPNSAYESTTDPNAYAITKQLYLGDLCSKPSLGPLPGNWSFWKVFCTCFSSSHPHSSWLRTATLIKRQASVTRHLSTQAPHSNLFLLSTICPLISHLLSISLQLRGSRFRMDLWGSWGM